MVTPGTYKATVISHAISETRAGAPQATVTFSFSADGRPQSMTWFGSFKEGALKHTLKSLLVCGLKGNNPAGPLEIGKEVSIVVDDQAGEDGKMRSRVLWVNAIGAARNIIPPDMAKAKLSGLEGAIIAARQETNIHEDDELPF